MEQQLRDYARTLGHYVLWAALAALLALVLYQLHAALVFVGLEAVENPSTRMELFVIISRMKIVLK